MSVGNVITIVSVVFGVIVSVIGFFLRRTINQVDTKATKTDVEALEQHVCELDKTVNNVKTDYLTKEDFFREQAKTDRKLDRIMEILMEMHGGKRG